MTNPTDNQTPQPVDDELHAITKELFLAGVRQGYQEATYGKSDPAGPEAQKAKARLLQWGTRQRIDELAGVRGWTEYDPDPKYSPRERFHIVPYIYLINRIAELQASLKDGGKTE